MQLLDGIAIEALPDTPLAAALPIVAPLIDHARSRVHRGARRLVLTAENSPVDPGTVDTLAIPALLRTLAGLLSQTCILELNVARLEGRLPGNTPEERFANFFSDAGRPERAVGFLDEYPGLRDQAVTACETWAETTVELVRRLHDDWRAIRTCFPQAETAGTLSGLTLGSGDSHRGGRAVAIVTFESGWKLVYKPRSLAAESHFQRLLEWMNDRGASPQFRPLAIVAGEHHGWMEHVAPSACHTLAEVRRFYRRVGGQLALLYALGARDVHHENLIASGEHPLLIDLEALFHPQLAGAANGATADALASSVIATGLLPARLAGGQANGDLSGVGADEDQLFPGVVPRWVDTGTDTMRVVEDQVAVGASAHRPSLGEERIDFRDHLDQVLGGFEHAYRLMCRHRGDLLSDGGPLVRFRSDWTRVIVRPTSIYGALLAAAQHPDSLRAADERDRLFARIERAAHSLPALTGVVEAERADLESGDVPVFVAQPSSRDLWTSGWRRLPNVLVEPGMCIAQRRISELSDADLARQLWCIRAAYATVRPAAHSDRAGQSTPRRASRSIHRGNLPGRLLSHASAIGDRLEELALVTGQTAAWLGLTITPDQRTELTSLDDTLYGGVPGVALFLLYLGAVTGRQHYTRLGERALQTSVERLSREPNAAVGAFTGLAGFVYVLAHAAAFDGSRWLRHAGELIARIEAIIPSDRQFDVIGGCAGTILALLALRDSPLAEPALIAATRAGDHLVAHATESGPGLGWIGPGDPLPLPGFAHGTAGIALALTRLSLATGEQRFREAAGRAIAYESSLFVPEARNWRDVRAAFVGMEQCPVAWCHGAAGIGLARVRLLECGGDERLRGDLDAAVSATLAAAPSATETLCHGTLGRLELLLEASMQRDDARLGTDVMTAAAMLLDAAEREGWRCDGGFDSPELMTGLAGIGYGILRLAEPSQVPSVLALAPPPRGFRDGRGDHK